MTPTALLSGLALGGLAVGLASFLQPRSTDWQAQCETLAKRMVDSARQPRVLASQVERRIQLPGGPRLLGAQWDPKPNHLTVLDAEEAHLVTLDTLGRVIRSFGRAGEGPAEFRLSPVYVGSRQKFRIASDGRVFVLDDRFGHVFTRDRQSQELHFDTLPAALVTDAHVARIRNAWIVSLARRSVGHSAGASLVRLFVVPDTDAARLSPWLLGYVKNLLAEYPPTNGRFSASPYERLYRRTWDARGEHLAVISYHQFAVCVSMPGIPSSWEAWSVAASRRRVDGQERHRVLTERFGRSSGMAPMMNVRIEDVYRGKWPPLGPFYHDITALNDTTYAAVRLDPERGTTADMFIVGRGYAGSTKIPDSRTVMGGYEDGLLLLNSGDGIIEFLRVLIR